MILQAVILIILFFQHELSCDEYYLKINKLHIYSFGYHIRTEKEPNINEIVNGKRSIHIVLTDHPYLRIYDSLAYKVRRDTAWIGEVNSPRLVCIRQKRKRNDTIAFSIRDMQYGYQTVFEMDTNIIMLLRKKIPPDHQYGIDILMSFYRNE